MMIKYMDNQEIPEEIYIDYEHSSGRFLGDGDTLINDVLFRIVKSPDGSIRVLVRGLGVAAQFHLKEVSVDGFIDGIREWVGK